MLTRRERIRKTLKAGLHRLRPGGAPTVPVFLFGEMRSGTNMLLDCFDHCLATATYNESDPEAFVDFELRDLDAIRQLLLRSRASHAVFKPTADTNRAAELLDAFPHSRSVWIYRRYQDAINSALTKWKQHNEYLRLVLEEPQRARWRARGLTQDDVDLIRTLYARGLSEPSARALVWYVRNNAYLRDSLDRRPNLLLVNYEDLVQQPSAVLPRIFAFVDLPYRNAYARHVSTSSVGRSPDPEVDPEVERLCHDLKSRLDSVADRRVAT